jgi:adenylate cyclase
MGTDFSIQNAKVKLLEMWLRWARLRTSIRWPLRLVSLNSEMNAQTLIAHPSDTLPQKRHPALRPTLLSSFMLLVLLAVVALVYIFYTTNQSRLELTSRLRGQIANVVAAQLRDALEPPWTAVRTATAVATSGHLTAQATTTDTSLLLEWLQSVRLADSIYVADIAGRFAMVLQGNGELLVKKVQVPQLRQTYRLQPGPGMELGPVIMTEPYNPQERPWYKAAIKARTIVWSDVYAYVSGDLGITLSQPFSLGKSDADEQFSGVVAMDVRLRRLNSLLASLTPNKRDRIFLADATGTLIAASSGNDSVARQQQGRLIRFKANESPDGAIRAAAEALSTQLAVGQFSPYSVIEFEAGSGEDASYVLVAPFENTQGLRWMIGVVLSAEEFDGHIRKRLESTIAAAVLLMSAAIVLAWWLSKRISGPVRTLSDAAREIARGNLQQRVPGGVIHEVQELSESFNLMSDKLEAAFSELQDTNEHLEQRVETRTLELKQARDETNRLLLNILPAQVADRLKNGNVGVADSFNEVTILFADLCDFTQLAAVRSPQTIVGLLNTVFSEFDEVAADLGLEKIKTIGDSYLVAAGLPQRCDDHAERVARFALRLHAAAARAGQSWGCDIKLRIGMHSGPVVAGVIGKHKFSYDIWGDAVNLASRMESSGEPGRIQVSAHSHALLHDKFVLEPRGSIDVKHFGKMQTYWLLSEKLPDSAT